MARGGNEQQQRQPPRGGAGGGGRPRGRWRANMAQRLRAYLFAGIIVTAPISITLLIVWEVVRYFDTTVAGLIPARYNPETYLPFSLPGIGLVIMLGCVMLIGWFAAGLVGRTVMRAGEVILDRTPVVRAIYGTLKQVFETIFTQSSRAFREVVLVEFPQPGSFALGFVTGTAGPEIQRASDDDGAGGWRARERADPDVAVPELGLPPVRAEGAVVASRMGCRRPRNERSQKPHRPRRGQDGGRGMSARPTHRRPAPATAFRRRAPARPRAAGAPACAARWRPATASSSACTRRAASSRPSRPACWRRSPARAATATST
jgi:hypothetical protein